MPGPLGNLGPTVDPNWAWDTYGWTNQGNTQDVEGQNLSSPGQGSMLIEPAALSGYIARTLDPDVTTAGGTGTTTGNTAQTAYLAAMQVMEPAVTSKVVYNQSTLGVTSPHLYFALYNATTGAQVAVTADQGAGSVAVQSVSWTSSVALAPGYYWALMLSLGTTTPKLQAFTLSGEAQKLLSGTGVLNYTIGTTLRFATGTSAGTLTGISTPPAALTSAMTVSANTVGWFVGIA